MFDCITLGMSGDVNLIQSRLYGHPECVFPITIFKDDDTESVTYIEFKPKDDLFVLDRYVNVVAEYIIDRYEMGFLRKIIEEKYKELSVVAKREILKNAERLADDSEVGYHARKQSVLLSIYDYLQEDCTMLIDGFVAFRLKDYEMLLEKLAERLVEQYVAHKEYEEFVDLLKYFVNIQSPRPQMIHVVVKEGGGYRIVNHQGEDITSRCFSDFVESVALLTEEAYDDLLIRVLITLAPMEITVHHRKKIQNHELFSTITQVFGGQIRYCDGCPICEKGEA